MKQIYFYLILIAATGTVIYSGCDSTTVDAIDSVTIPSSNVSYSTHIQPVFNLKCAVEGCHDVESRAGSLSLTSWSATTSDITIVFPGDPTTSRLVWSIDDDYGSTTPMPPIDSGVPTLTDNQVQGIKTWIEEGAENN
jgi:hypothetical protein